MTRSLFMMFWHHRCLKVICHLYILWWEWYQENQEKDQICGNTLAFILKRKQGKQTTQIQPHKLFQHSLSRLHGARLAFNISWLWLLENTKEYQDLALLKEGFIEVITTWIDMNKQFPCWDQNRTGSRKDKYAEVINYLFNNLAAALVSSDLLCNHFHLPTISTLCLVKPVYAHDATA